MRNTVAVSDMLFDEELCMRLEVAQVTEVMFVWLPFLMNSSVLFQEKSALEDFAAIKASVLVLWMILEAMFVQIDEIPPINAANITRELQMRLMLDDVILETEVAFEGQLAIHAGIRDLHFPVICLKVLF